LTCNRMPEMGSSIYVNGCSCSSLWNEIYEGNKTAETTSETIHETERENCSGNCMPNDNFGVWPIGMTYVPMQPWEQPFDLVKGLRAGTIFPSLRLPFRGGGR